VQERTDRPAALDRRGRPASRAGTRPPAAPAAEGMASVVVKRLEAALDWPSRQGPLVWERPVEGGG